MQTEVHPLGISTRPPRLLHVILGALSSLGLAIKGIPVSLSGKTFRDHSLPPCKRGTATRKGWWRETGCGWPRRGGAGAWKFHYFLSILISRHHHPAPS